MSASFNFHPCFPARFVQAWIRLGPALDWERDNPDEHTWIWLPKPDANTGKKQGGVAIDTLRDGQHPISGTLELKPGVLMLTTNSMERSQRGQGILEALLHGLVGPALSKLQTPEQLMAESSPVRFEWHDTRGHYFNAVDGTLPQ